MATLGTEQMTNYVVLVDEHDNELGYEEKMSAHEKAKLHRAFSIFLYKRQGSQLLTLLQQRESSKYHCGDLWTNTCCSHPKPNESLLAAGQRRLDEELGIQGIELMAVGAFIYRADFNNGLCEHEYDHVLVGQVKDDLTMALNPNEVQATQWMSFDQLFGRLAEAPTEFTPWLAQAARLASNHLNGI